jgi:hypothetical protein
MIRFALILFLASLVCAPAWAAREGTVVVFSGPCNGESSPLESRGMAVSHQGAGYVVTSHHRIFNGGREKGVCHWVDHTKRPAELISWDWAKGLALLKVPGLKARPKPEKWEGDALFDVTLASGEKGEAQTKQTDRHHIPDPGRAVLDITSFKITPELIGSPIYDHEGSWVGIVSHQYIGSMPGQGSPVLTWDFEPRHGESHVLAISAGDCWRFVDAGAGRAAVALNVSFEDQIAGISRVSRDGLYFQEECGPSAAALLELENNPGPAQSPAAPVGRGVGGGFGAPIGGSTDVPSCRIRVYRDEFGTSARSGGTGPGGDVSSRLKPLLARGGTALIPFSVSRDVHGALVPHFFSSLQHFFRQLGSSRQVVILLDSQARAARPEDTGLAELRREVLEFSTFVPKKPGGPILASIVMFARLHMAMALLSSESWKDLKAEELDEFLYDPSKRSPWDYALPIGRYPACNGPCPDTRVLEVYLAKLKRIRELRAALERAGR